MPIVFRIHEIAVEALFDPNSLHYNKHVIQRLDGLHIINLLDQVSQSVLGDFLDLCGLTRESNYSLVVDLPGGL